MKQKELLETARESNHYLSLGSTWVEVLVLRRYRGGRAESLRVDDSTRGELEIPDDCSHVLVAIELPIAALLNRSSHETGQAADSRIAAQ
jgi:hypothetical protein